MDRRDDAVIADDAEADSELGLLDLVLVLTQNAGLLLGGPILAGLVALSASYLITPTFTASTTFLPPQQQQSAAAAALSSLGALSGLAGVAGGVRTPGDQYVSLLQSVSVTDRLIDEFKLLEAYKAEFRFEARRQLARNVRINLGKKDGLITVEVDDTDPQRAAALANRHVEELRRMTSSLALTEAQQRRVFFEDRLKQSRDALGLAQQTLQSSGFNQSALRAEPKSAAEGYARLKAELTSSEVRLQTLRRALADNAPEVQQQLARLGALRGQLSKLETGIDASSDADYIGKYREFKYQETLFELFSRQYELARLDESREGALIQVIDAAVPAEHKTKPKRLFIATVASVATGVLLLLLVVVRRLLAESSKDPVSAAKLQRLRRSIRAS